MSLEKLFEGSELPVGFYFLKTPEEVYGTGVGKEDNPALREAKARWKPYFKRPSVHTRDFQALPAKKAPTRIIHIR